MSHSDTMSDIPRVFNRRAVRLHRERAASNFAEHAFLFNEVGERLADRLDDIKRRFPLALDLGCHDGELRRILGDRGGVRTLVQCDLSPTMVSKAGGLSLAADEEHLPFAGEHFDLILSNLSLHWVNDLPGALTQIRAALKPDGLFLAALFGGETLTELRQALAAAEIANESGLSPRVSPFAEVRDAGNLLGRAGFALPVADTETVTVSYGDPWRLLADLRGMGEANAAAERRPGFTRRTTLMDAMARYQEMFGDAEGRVPATFQVIYLTAWAPHAAQPRPLKPGSATTSLADALDGSDTPSGRGSGAG